ncbi:hypothetical protein O181_125309, partial [Austropuccinia psidii MF-1]|nr:hypothetical protein [Austropuccinia psidii MF-1]
MPTEVEINIPIDESSDEEVHLKTKMIKLNPHNWVQWSCQMENYLTSRQFDDLLQPPSEATKVTPKFKQKNSSALLLLWGCVSTELEGVLLDNKTSFYDTWEALGKLCGKNSIVVICETFYELMSLRYEPESSLQTHIYNFQKTFARYNSITTDKELGMTISPVMAAATFVHSLNNDRELTGLIQTLYDIKPFNLSTVINRVAVEHSRCQQPSEQALFTNTKYQHKSRQEEKKFKGKGRKFGKKPENPNQQSIAKTEADKRFENLEKMIANLQATMSQQSAHLITEQPEKAVSSDSDTFMIQEDIVLNVNE